MASDKLVDSTQLDADLTSVANAIRTKGGTSASLAFPAGFVQAIADIPSGGGTDYLSQLLTKTITDYENSTVTDITAYRTFYQQTNLRSVSFSEIVTFNGGYAFYECTALESISFPKLEYINGAQAAFQGCTSLEVVVFPKHYRTFQSSIFQGCTSLQIYDAGIPTAPTGNYNMFAQNFFNGDTALHTIIIRTENRIGGLGNINTFTGTRFASGGAGGTIYIPKALYDHLGDGTSLDYKAATNWSTVNGYGTITWAKIEGSQYENYYADGTPIA